MHHDPYGTGNTAGFQVFNNQTMRTTQARHLQAATFKQATDPGEGIDHYKKLFSFSKYTIVCYLLFVKSFLNTFADFFAFVHI